MKIILDAMGGDNAPLAVLRGAAMALAEIRGLSVTLVGDVEQIQKTALENGVDLSRFEIVAAKSTVRMEDPPMCVVRDKNDSSMAVGLRLLAAGEGDAFVSAGNTGALLVGASLLVRRIRGISRPGIASVLPLTKPVLLLDSGANLEVSEDNMEDFAVMGSVYMSKLYGIEAPRVGQINNGTEPNKGLPLQIATYKRLSVCDHIDFVGNVEGKEIPFGACDVLVADGFTGNAVLKLAEGMGKFMMKNLKELLGSGIMSLCAAIFLRGKIKKMKKAYSASEHGGAPILGVRRPVIKAHGGSDANAIKNAIRQAIRFTDNGVNEEIAATISKIREKSKADSTMTAKTKEEALLEAKKLEALKAEDSSRETEEHSENVAARSDGEDDE